MREREWRKLMRDLDDAEAAYASERRGDMEELIDFIRRGLQALREDVGEVRREETSQAVDIMELRKRLERLEMRIEREEASHVYR